MPVRTLGQVEIDNNKLTDPWRNRMTVLDHGHLTEDAIESYSLGRLPDPESEIFEEHVLLCASCQDRLQQMDEFIAAFKVASAKMRREPLSSESELPAVERLRRKLLTLWHAFTPASALAARQPSTEAIEGCGQQDIQRGASFGLLRRFSTTCSECQPQRPAYFSVASRHIAHGSVS